MNGPQNYTAAAEIADIPALHQSPDDRSIPYLLVGLIHAVQANTAATLEMGVGATTEGWAEAVFGS